MPLLHIKSYLFWLSQLIRKCYCSSTMMPRTWPRIVRRSQRASMIPIASASAIPWNTRQIYMLLRVVVVMALQDLLLLPSVFAATVSHHITHVRKAFNLVLDYKIEPTNLWYSCMMHASNDLGETVLVHDYKYGSSMAQIWLKYVGDGQRLLWISLKHAMNLIKWSSG